MEKQNVICNRCGKEFESVDGILHEDGLFVKKEWGYFNGKALKAHSFNLCEACYDRLLEEFEIPVTVEDKEVVLD